MIGRNCSIIAIIVLMPVSSVGATSIPLASDAIVSIPTASMGLIELVTRRVASSDRIRSAIARPIAAPDGRPVSGISLPMEYMITEGWLRSLLTIASTSACHQSGNDCA